MAHWTLRLLRHRRVDAADARRLLGRGAAERLAARVAASERRHGGEIRVCIEAGLPVEALRRGITPRERAIALFGEFGVWNTDARNGVLVYLLLAERAIEIVADRGVDGAVDPATWPRVLAAMQAAFREGRFEAGLGEAIDAVDALLVRHFPLAAGESNANELPDAPLFR